MQEMKSREAGVGSVYVAFKSINAAISSTIDQSCSLKPEVSLLIELYEAEKQGRMLTASSVGLEAGIPQTTSIRYVRYLEECGWVIRSPHPTDGRVSYLRIAPALFLKIDEAFAEQCRDEAA